MLMSNNIIAQTDLDDKTATVNIIRQTGYSGSATGLKVFIDSAMLCKINTGKYLSIEVLPGVHTLSAQFYGSKPRKSGVPFQFDAEAGSTYYFMITQSVHVASTEVFISRLDENIGKQKMLEKSEDPDCR